MAKRKPALTEEILADVRHKPPGFTPWNKQIPTAVLRELEQLRARWWTGEVQSSAIALARQISTVLKRRGLSTIGEQGVLRWLRDRQ